MYVFEMKGLIIVARGVYMRGMHAAASQALFRRNRQQAVAGAGQRAVGTGRVFRMGGRGCGSHEVIRSSTKCPKAVI